MGDPVADATRGRTTKRGGVGGIVTGDGARRRRRADEGDDDGSCLDEWGGGVGMITVSGPPAERVTVCKIVNRLRSGRGGIARSAEQDYLEASLSFGFKRGRASLGPLVCTTGRTRGKRIIYMFAGERWARLRWARLQLARTRFRYEASETRVMMSRFYGHPSPDLTGQVS